MLLENLFYFLGGFGIMWFASGLVVRGIERFSRDIKISTFAASFLILGVLTSLTEISVGLNAVLDKKPSIFVGNLIGGSFVILLLIVPLLAIFSKGITLKHRLDQKRLLFFLILIFAPSFLILDGQISTDEGLSLIVLYGLFFYLFQGQEQILDRLRLNHYKNSPVTKEILLIILGAGLIYFSGKILVEETIFFSAYLAVPPLLLSLLVLSLGTNLPEMLIAVRSIQRRHQEIAFGDYIGSAATNTLLFGIFTVLNGPFTLETKGFNPLFLVILCGYVLFFIFARIKNRISPLEGLILILVYVVFLLFQTTEILTLSPEI